MSIRTEREDTFKIILSATNKLVDFVAPTYGPAANKVIIDRQLYRMVVDDGVQIARDFELDDEAENAVIKVIKETAIKTNDRAGDGTTGSLIMLGGILNDVSKQNVRNGRLIEAELKKGVQEVREYLEKTARPIKSQDELQNAARISFDNPQIADLVADLLYKVGKDGVVTMDQSNTMETTAEYTEGIEIKQGYISPYMINDPQRSEANLEKPHILVTNYRITNANDILPIMNKLIDDGKRELLVICDNIEADALATLVVNRVQGKFMGVAVQIPQSEDKQQFLKDIALITGATYFSEEAGNRIDQASLSDLGRADRAVVRKERTIIAGGKGKKADMVKEKSHIRDLIAANPKDSEKKNLEMRLARLVNGVAVVRVGAPTENEQKALKYKVEDTINATKAAMNGGVVAGSGVALSQITTSSDILNRALKQPLIQMQKNMGIDPVTFKKGEAYNVITGEQGDYFKIGVIDPVDVLIAAVESAVSISSILVTTHAILCESSKEETK